MPMSLAGLPLIDPQSLKEDCDRLLLDTSKWWGRANSFVVPLHSYGGSMWGVGLLLMDARTYADLPADTDEMDLAFIDPYGRAVTFVKVCLLTAEAATSSDPTCSASQYLLAVADRRYRLDQVAVGREYNTRAVGGGYVAASLDAGVAWTWAGVVGDIWAKMRAVYPDLPATAPQFPSAPAGTPEGFYLYDPGAWAALWRVVEAAGFLLRYDPTTDVADILDAADDDPVAADQAGRFVLSNVPYRSRDAVWPAGLRVTFPVMGSNERDYVEVVLGLGGAAGTVEIAPDDLPSVTGNAASLADRADAVAKIWVWSATAGWNNVCEMLQGVVQYPRRTLGHGHRTHWAVQDLGGDEMGFGGTVSSAGSEGFWTPRPGLRLDDSGGGGGCGDLPARDVVTSVCPIYDGYGAMTGTTVEYTPLSFVAGCPVWGTPYCVDNPTACCPTVWYCLTDECAEQPAADPAPPGATGGPFATQSICLDSCGISAECCPTLPLSMTLTVSGTGGGSFVMPWDGTSMGAFAANWDTGLVSLGGAGAGTITLRFYCFGAVPTLQNNTGSPDYTVTFNPDAVATCDPFSYTRTGVLVGGGAYNGETRTFTLTPTP